MILSPQRVQCAKNAFGIYIDVVVYIFLNDNKDFTGEGRGGARASEEEQLEIFARLAFWTKLISSFGMARG